MSKSVKTILILSAIVLALILVFVLKPNQAISPATNTPPPVPPTSKATTIFFAGDIMLSRNVAGKIYEKENPNLPFLETSGIIQSSNIAFANLESPFNNEGRHSVQNSLIFNADPIFVNGLKFAGFDILSTANNHVLDQGQKGIDYTIDWLTANNIVYTGTRHSKAQVVDPIIKHNDIILFGFLAYSYTAENDGGKTKSPYVNDFYNVEKMKQDVIDMKGHTADAVIVSMHAGTEYSRQPTEDQIKFAHSAIDAGADIVIGHHPHWIQTVENYKGKWIFYSLGNFVFDQMWSDDTREGLTLQVTYSDNAIQKIELKPVIIDNYCCPRWANEEETKSILEKIDLTSPILFSTIR
ncbi:MAG: CapA family protein [Candidatus Doudnabacteria bacterium]|nr:CapA family protein [Candidatus Doudnabacteria bacterium]